MVITPFELIKEQIDVECIREVANIKDDELLKLFFAYLVCESASNIKLPSKKHKTELARELLKRGVSESELIERLRLSKRTFLRIKSEKREHSFND